MTTLLGPVVGAVDRFEPKDTPDPVQPPTTGAGTRRHGRAVRSPAGDGTRHPPESRPGQVDVLVVDDDEDVRESMAAVLRLDGLTVAEAGDGEAAMNVLECTEVGAVVVDLHMAPRDGVWLLEQMTDPPVVIVVSAFALYDENQIRGRFADIVAHYLRKPVAPSTLIETLRRSLNR